MNIANLNTAASALYDTPPNGDFVRYVDQLLAHQTAGSAVHAAAHGLLQAPGAAKASKSAAAAVGAPQPVGQRMGNKADELLERIRQLEALRRGSGNGASASTSAGPASGDKRMGFQLHDSKLATVSNPGGLKLLGYAVLVVLGLIFPPLGVVLLIGLAKKWFSAKAKN